MRFQPRRELGGTGFKVTRLGIGDLADRKIPLEQCVATLRRALDAGLNLVDTAPGYEDGYSEEIVGQALAGRREGIFLIDKIDHFDRPVAAQIEGSLARLKLPSTDAFVFHSVSQPAQWAEISKPGGRFDELDACRKAGQTRFVGISSHHPDVLRAALASKRCDLVMFPVGPFVDTRYIDEILPEAKRMGVGTVCFKTFGAGKLLGDTDGYNQPLQARPRGKVSSGGAAGEAQLPRMQVAECLHYTLTRDPDVALLGLSFPNEQDEAFAAAEDFRPLPASSLRLLETRAKECIAEKGRIWWNP